jgi:hypothetical protein
MHGSQNLTLSLLDHHETKIVAVRTLGQDHSESGGCEHRGLVLEQAGAGAHRRCRMCSRAAPSDVPIPAA